MIFELDPYDVKYGKVAVHTSIYSVEPQIKLGYTNFLNKNREKLDIVNKLPESQQKVHLIVNSLEVGNGVAEEFKKKYFKETYTGELDNQFFHLWEILMDHKLLKDKKPICTASISTNPDISMTLLSLYRNTEKDVYCAINYEPTEQTVECHHGRVAKFKIENLKNVKVLKKDFFERTKEYFKKKQPANFVFAELGHQQEPETYEVLIGFIAIGMNILAKEGVFILKVGDIFTPVTLKLILLLNTCFEKVLIHKPLTAQDHVTDKYIVCINYKEDKDLVKDLTSLVDKVLKESDEYVQDIFPELVVPPKFVEKIYDINRQIVHVEYQCINKMYEFILEKNYYGVKYHNYLEIQQKNSELWIRKYI